MSYIEFTLMLLIVAHWHVVNLGLLEVMGLFLVA